LIIKNMTPPEEEERLWIEKYREALDARLMKNSRRSGIRAAWSRINSVLGFTQAIPPHARTANVTDACIRPSTLTPDQAEQFRNDASCQEKNGV
jgi:hypothetical protein